MYEYLHDKTEIDILSICIFKDDGSFSAFE